MIGGGVISKEKLEALRKSLPKTIVLTGYGITELQGAAFYFDLKTELKLALFKSTSVGKVLQGYSYKVLNNNINLELNEQSI